MPSNHLSHKRMYMGDSFLLPSCVHVIWTTYYIFHCNSIIRDKSHKLRKWPTQILHSLTAFWLIFTSFSTVLIFRQWDSHLSHLTSILIQLIWAKYHTSSVDKNKFSLHFCKIAYFIKQKVQVVFTSLLFIIKSQVFFQNVTFLKFRMKIFRIYCANPRKLAADFLLVIYRR